MAFLNAFNSDVQPGYEPRALIKYVLEFSDGIESVPLYWTSLLCEVI